MNFVSGIDVVLVGPKGFLSIAYSQSILAAVITAHRSVFVYSSQHSCCGWVLIWDCKHWPTDMFYYLALVPIYTVCNVCRSALHNRLYNTTIQADQ